MKNNLKSLIADCVLKNVIFNASVGTSYTVQELVSSVQLPTIEGLHTRVNTELSKLKTNTLSKRSSQSNSSLKKNKLELQADTLEAIYTYKEDNLDRASKAAETRKNNIAELAMIKEALLGKKVESIKGLTDAELNKRKEELESSN